VSYSQPAIVGLSVQASQGRGAMEYGSPMASLVFPATAFTFLSNHRCSALSVCTSTEASSRVP
jgi:hypothetical protein